MIWPSVGVMTPDNVVDPTDTGDQDKKLPFSFDPRSKSGLFSSPRSILSLSASAAGRQRSDSFSKEIQLQSPRPQSCSREK